MKFYFENIEAFENSGSILETLDLSFSNISTEEISRLSISPLVEHLKILRLDGVKGGDEIVSHLCSGFDYKFLEELSLSNNEISDHGIEVFIHHLSQFPRLIRLNLRRNKIGSKGARLIGESLGLRRLESLNLDYNENIPSQERAFLASIFGSRLN